METVPNTFPDLFYAYTTMWILIALYVALLGCRLSSLEKRYKKSEDQDSQ